MSGFDLWREMGILRARLEEFAREFNQLRKDIDPAVLSPEGKASFETICRIFDKDILPQI